MSRRLPVLAVLVSLVALAVPGAATSAVAQQTLPPIAPYADVCSDAPPATDLRRLHFGVADESTYGAIVAGCSEGGAADWDLVITVPGGASDGNDAIRRVRLRTTGGAPAFTVTDETTGAPVPLYAGNGLRRDDRSIQVLVPAEFIAPVGDELLLRVETADDRLPDAGRPLVRFPSPCVGPAATATATTTVLRVEDGQHGTVAAAARAAGTAVGTVDAALGVVEVETTDERTVRELAALPGVAAVEVAPPMTHTAVVPNDPRFGEQQGLEIIRAPEAWETRTRSGVRVAVLDDGIDATRPDLAGRVVAGYDVVRREAIAPGVDSDLGGHGTAVAGILGATGNDGVGMAGTDWGALLVPVRVFDEMGCASSADVAAGIRAATDAGARVLNLSLGGPSSSPSLDDAIAYATSRGALIVAAAGNAGPGTPPMHPAAHPEVVAVGATTGSDTIAPYSNQGAHLELTAPGGSAGDGILTLEERGTYGRKTGTSFAAPFVAGAASLYLGEHPRASRADVRAALAAAVVDLGDPGRDPVFGHGRLDLARLLPVGAPSQTEATDPCDGAPPAEFTDVSGGVHAASIDCLVFLGITRGLTATTYGPDRSVTRGQMATFVAESIRAAGGTLPTASGDAFHDDDGTTHERNIDALAAAGIVGGVGGGRYEPGATVSRAQMASFLARAYEHVADRPLPDAPDAFVDDEGNTHEANIDRVAAAGIASGTGNGRYEPGSVVRRDQMASFLVRLARVLAGTAA